MPIVYPYTREQAEVREQFSKTTALRRKRLNKQMDEYLTTPKSYVLKSTETKSVLGAVVSMTPKEAAERNARLRVKFAVALGNGKQSASLFQWMPSDPIPQGRKHLYWKAHYFGK